MERFFSMYLLHSPLSSLCIPVPCHCLSCRSRCALLVKHCQTNGCDQRILSSSSSALVLHTLSAPGPQEWSISVLLPLHICDTQTLPLIYGGSWTKIQFLVPPSMMVDFYFVSMQDRRTKNAFCPFLRKDGFPCHTLFQKCLLHMRKDFREWHGVSRLSSHPQLSMLSCMPATQRSSCSLGLPPINAGHTQWRLLNHCLQVIADAS